MSTEKSAQLSTSTAILIGSCIVAIGLYLGLRERRRDEPAAPAPVVSAAKEAAAPVAVPTAKPAPNADKAAVIREASAVLDKQKKTLTEKCLAPSLAKKPNPTNVKYIFNITFNAQGNVLARGVAEDRETSRPEVLQCISENFPAVKVTPPGQTVLVDVPFELP